MKPSPFLRNCWYVAAWSHEVGSDTLFERTLLGEPILLYRDPAAQPIALTNRCCHRHAPLSLGRKEADCIRCNYHGLKFDRAGRCVEVPGQASVPEKLCVRAWPMVERHNWLWIWMGDAALADPALIPDAFSLDHPDWKIVSDYLHYQAPYLLICDNLLDFSHLSYVHANTLGGSTDIAESRPQVTASARSVRVQRFIPNAEPSPAQRQHHGFTGKVDRTFVYDFIAPAVMLLDTRSETVADPNGARLHMHSCQALTPETETTTHYFFSQAHQTGLSEPQDRKPIHTALLAAFAEDQHITPGAIPHDAGIAGCRGHDADCRRSGADTIQAGDESTDRHRIYRRAATGAGRKNQGVAAAARAEGVPGEDQFFTPQAAPTSPG